MVYTIKPFYIYPKVEVVQSFTKYDYHIEEIVSRQSQA